jgi:hypothetical protein
MAYDPTKLTLVSTAPLAGRGQLWRHESTDAGAAVQVDGFITDAAAKGMRVGDQLEHYETDTNIVSRHVVVAINANGSADLSNATTVGSGTDSD